MLQTIFQSKSSVFKPILSKIKGVQQNILMKECVFRGVGVHSGEDVEMKVSPSLKGGYTFIRSDIDENNEIDGIFFNVTSTMMSTALENPWGVQIKTVEHILAALYGLHIHNAEITISGPEIPIMDGSSFEFVEILKKCIKPVWLGFSSPKVFKVTKPVRVESKTGYAEFLPSKKRTFDVLFDFAGNFSGTPYEGSFHFDLENDSFENLISDARTFGLYDDAKKLQDMGLAKGASLKNTVIIKDSNVMNDDGLRSQDEMVRHKVLDAIGDIALCSGVIQGAYKAYNPGHDLNNKLLHAYFKSL